MVLQVSDSASHRDQQIANAARAIGTSARKRAVFEAIHHHKKAIKTVSEVVARTGLTRMAVLQAGGELARKRIVEQVKHECEVAYRKNDFLQQHKGEVLALAGNEGSLAKRSMNPGPMTVKVVRASAPAPAPVQITVDDIANFRKCKRVRVSDHLPSDLSETAFKEGVQAIIGEPGKFSDWSGERQDLLTTRLIVEGRRRAAAFAFKGPGKPGPLTPAKMGKNGDQISRLFKSAADVFIVQHWREINESVLDQMRAHAGELSRHRKVWFGIIDGYDSRRIYEAYRAQFARRASQRCRTGDRRTNERGKKKRSF